MGPDEAVARLAAGHFAVFAGAQARGLGMTPTMLRRRVAKGLVERMEPGVYRFTAAPRCWEQSVMAACLAERGWASHRTAAALWQLDGCSRGIIEVLTPRWRRRPNRSVRVHESTVVGEPDLAELTGIPVTSAERTLVDLGAVVPEHRVRQAYYDALNRKIVTPESMWRCLERLDSPGRPWVRVPRLLVAGTIGSNEVRPNVFEERLVALLVRSGLPAPATQVEIHRNDGTVLGRVDAVYLDTKVVLECDSERWHGGWTRRKQDLRRDRELTALGYRVLRISWEDLEEREDDVVRDVVGARLAASA